MPALHEGSRFVGLIRTLHEGATMEFRLQSYE